MTGLLDALEAIETHLARLRRPVVSLLQPGLPSSTISEAISLHGLPTLNDMTILWGWRDGTRVATDATIDDLSLIPGFYLLSLTDSLLHFDQFVVSPRWRRSWLPILANGGGDFFALDLSENSAEACVRHFRIEESDHPIEYRNLADMIDTFRAAYDRGSFYLHRDGYLEMDYQAYAAIAAELNPCVAWWQE